MPSRRPPLDLPRLILRRAGTVGLLVLVLATAGGLWRVSHDIDEEVEAAMALASLSAQLTGLERLDDATALARLRDAAAARALRHLELHLHDGQGAVLLAPPPGPAVTQPLAAVLQAHRRWLTPDAQRTVAWRLPRPDGSAWTARLSASAEAERREALGDLLGTLALLAAGVALLLGVLTLNVRRAFRPLADLLRAIEGIDAGHTAAARDLPPMALRELESIAAALRRLGTALDTTQARRRALARQLMSVQEDERLHLARELHDELGQHLTALRLDARWLEHRLREPDDPAFAELRPVVASMAARCAELHGDVRALLARLRPLGPADDDACVGLDALAIALERLLQSWRALPSLAEQVALSARVLIRHPDGRSDEDPAALATLQLPAALAQAIYRLSQEALTNAARHAATARRFDLSLSWCPAAQGPGELRWDFADDGPGLADAEAARTRGSGLGGMQERVWALGGHWTLASGDGLRLQARWPLETRPHTNGLADPLAGVPDPSVPGTDTAPRP